MRLVLPIVILGLTSCGAPPAIAPTAEPDPLQQLERQTHAALARFTSPWHVVDCLDVAFEHEFGVDFAAFEAAPEADADGLSLRTRVIESYVALQAAVAAESLHAAALETARARHAAARRLYEQRLATAATLTARSSELTQQRELQASNVRALREHRTRLAAAMGIDPTAQFSVAAASPDVPQVPSLTRLVDSWRQSRVEGDAATQREVTLAHAALADAILAATLSRQARDEARHLEQQRRWQVAAGSLTGQAHNESRIRALNAEARLGHALATARSVEAKLWESARVTRTGLRR